MKPTSVAKPPTHDRRRTARRRIVRLASALPALAVLAPVPGQAQSQPPASASTDSWPTRPIRLIVPFPPGGSTDGVIRLLAPRLAERLGQQVVIENRPGAGGNIGLEAVAKAEPDGYTIGVGAAGGLAANVSLYAKMPYDPARDFAPLGLVAPIPFVLVASPAQSDRTLADVIRRSRAAPLAIGHGGNGTAMHLSVQLLKQMASVPLNEVAYRGSGPVAIDVIGGQVPLGMVDLPSALQQIKAGRLLALAVTGTTRVRDLPDVPTVAEAGVAGYESTGWFGMVAPAATPRPVLARLEAALQSTMAEPAMRDGSLALGVELAPTSPEDFGRFIRSEIVKWREVIRTSGTQLQ